MLRPLLAITMMVVGVLGCLPDEEELRYQGADTFDVEPFALDPGLEWDCGDVVTLKHDRCSYHLPCQLPELPEVNGAANDRPLFDYWRDLDCTTVAQFQCQTSFASCEPGSCFPLTESGDGVCAYPDVDILCDGEGEVVGYRDGRCWMCLPPEAHAAACCAGVEGVDCRAWPYQADGQPGMVCARHEDCEPGLICGPAKGSGYGICQCPETYGYRPSIPEDCY